MTKHHQRAVEFHDLVVLHADPYNNASAALECGKLSALIAIALAQRGQLQELRKIRRLLEQRHSNATVHFNGIATLVPKDGGSPMPAPVVNPTETQDVQCTISPTNRAGQPTTGPFNWTENNGQLTLVPAADGKSCLAVTPPGAIDAVVTVTDTVSGNTDTFPVQRVVGTTDNLTINFNPASTAVDKAAPPPTP